ncbi:MAG TPA: GNAT family N-acetyltransferase [Candidatus Cryosericum sp.]|nr:GNAT family N-acetyltransferase [Candidatus Cryosericum sp.]
MSAVSIRQATREDTPAIARIINASWRAAYAGIVPQDVLDALSDEKKQAQLAAGLEHSPEMSYYLLELGGISAGAASLHPTRDEDLQNTAEFSFFYFLPQYWRGGYGTRLLEHVEQTAREHGFTRICCWTLAENARAISFYEANGYRCDGARQEVTIGIPLEVIRLIKTL